MVAGYSPSEVGSAGDKLRLLRRALVVSGAHNIILAIPSDSTVLSTSNNYLSPSSATTATTNRDESGLTTGQFFFLI